MTRPISRIDPALARLAKAWKHNPDLRLGQLLKSSCIHQDPIRSLTYIEDEELIDRAEKMLCTADESDKTDFDIRSVRMNGIRDRWGERVWIAPPSGGSTTWSIHYRPVRDEDFPGRIERVDGTFDDALIVARNIVESLKLSDSPTQEDT